VESKLNMAVPPRRWVGYALLAAGLSLLFDTFTFLLTNWSPLKVPMYAANELALGCLLTVAGMLLLLAPILKRTLLRIRIGVALTLIAASIYGGWEWWTATRTWVPLYMPVSLSQGHIRSPEFKINLDAGFWIFVEVETKVDDEGVSCLTGYISDYCHKNGVRELHASWTLSDRGRVVARGSTDTDQGSLGGMLTKGRGIGHFSVPSGDHFVLDVEFPEDNSHFDGGHPRLAIEQSYYWRFEENRTPVFLFAMFLGAIAAAFRRVSTTLRQVFTKFSEFFICCQFSTRKVASGSPRNDDRQLDGPTACPLLSLLGAHCVFPKSIAAGS